MFLGVVLLLDTGLMSIGNILFILGVPMLIGPKRTLGFFSRPGKVRGSICFVVGVLLVLFKMPFFGMGLELFGFINLFGDFFPAVVSFLRSLPFVGQFLSIPMIARVVDRFAGVSSPV
ncbi:Golgi Transport, variant 2 [Entomophthora muscae]|nr:Golgi Transport, variant 2 [Entomophthora muscae]